MSLFSCPSCFRTAIHNLSHESNAISSALLSNSRSRGRKSVHHTSSNRIFKRHHATYDSLVTGHHRRTLRLTLAKKTPPPPNTRRKGAGSLTKGEIKDAQARERNRGVLLTKDDGTAGDQNLNIHERRKLGRLKKDIEEYYSDPLQLANVVMSKLRIPDFEAAIGLVRASEGIVMKNIVSWNHCIDWCMSQGDSEKAWKLYNELKKRGHKPDSHTYTIVLRGLSQNSRKAGSAQRAVSIYNSMFAPNSAVVPNTIHTNAVLNVCARARDMESLWAIAGRLPERGSGSPDRWTFTTILNAVREDATARVADLLKNANGNANKEDEEGLTLQERQKVIFDEALKDGRKLWADVSFRWRRADLVIDEYLVCAMARLILGCGLRQDFGEVFDLVDSTMNIRLAERGHKKGVDADLENEQHDEAEEKMVENGKDLVLAKRNNNSLPLADEQVYAKPGVKTLSVILEAAAGSKQMKLGRSYWHLLTTPNGPHKVAPDADNIISYLRLLRLSRASTDALSILSREWPRDVAENLYRRGTFVIAMSTCVRDKNNQHAFDTADKLLTLMQEKLEEVKLGMYDKVLATETDPSLSYKERKALAKAHMAEIDDVTFGEDEGISEAQRIKSGVESSIVDPKALKMYIELAMLKTPGWNEGVEGKYDASEKFERDPKKNSTLKALRRLGPDMINISRLAKLKLVEAEVATRQKTDGPIYDLSVKAQRKVQDRAGTRVAEKLEDMIDLLRSMVSAYDRVIGINDRFLDEGKPGFDKKTIDNYSDLKRRVSAFLSRTKDEVAKVTRGSMKYGNWKNKPEEEHDEDEDDEDNDSYKSRRSFTSRKFELPKIGKEIQRIYQDTDHELGRLDQRSRRQRFERHNGVKQRMQKRLGTGQDPGVLDEDLSIKRVEEVEARMRQRAFKIKIGDGSSMTQAEEKRARRLARDGVVE